MHLINWTIPRRRARTVDVIAAARSRRPHQHVLREPALFAREDAADAKREALLAHQRVSAVAAAEGRDRVRVGDVGDDRLLRVARPVADLRNW